MPRGATDAGVGRSFSFTGVFVGCFVGVVVLDTTGFGVSSSGATGELGAFETRGSLVDVAGALVTRGAVAAAARASFVLAFALVNTLVELWLDFAIAGAEALVGWGAFVVGADAAPACDADVGVGAGVPPADDEALATVVVGHRPP